MPLPSGIVMALMPIMSCFVAKTIPLIYSRCYDPFNKFMNDYLGSFK